MVPVVRDRIAGEHHLSPRRGEPAERTGGFFAEALTALTWVFELRRVDAQQPDPLLAGSALDNDRVPVKDGDHPGRLLPAGRMRRTPCEVIPAGSDSEPGGGDQYDGRDQVNAPHRVIPAGSDGEGLDG